MFFRRVWYQYKGEAEVNLLYSKADKKYKLVARPQNVSGGGVSYSPKIRGEEDPVEVQFYSEQRKQGWLRVGTIHSHCDFGAFHSGTDTHDEEHQDGVHITCGNVNRKHFSMVASLVCNGNRFQVDPENVVFGIEPKSDNGGSKYSWMGSFSQPANYYDFTFTDEEIDTLIKEVTPYVVSQWMPLVSQTYSGSYRGWNEPWKGWQGDNRTISVPVGDKIKGGVVLPAPAPAGPGTNSPAPTTEALFDQPPLFPEGAFSEDETPTPPPEEVTPTANPLVAVIVSVKDDMVGCLIPIVEKLSRPWHVGCSTHVGPRRHHW